MSTELKQTQASPNAELSDQQLYTVVGGKGISLPVKPEPFDPTPKPEPQFPGTGPFDPSPQPNY